jgi:hypothetical protein
MRGRGTHKHNVSLKGWGETGLSKIPFIPTPHFFFYVQARLGPIGVPACGTRALEKAIEYQHMIFAMWCGMCGCNSTKWYLKPPPFTMGGAGVGFRVCAAQSTVTHCLSSKHCSISDRVRDQPTIKKGLYSFFTDSTANESITSNRGNWVSRPD